MKHPIDSRIRAPRRGFTLAELLIAIIILLFGVVAALRIFPPGFAAFNEAQMETVSQSLRENGLNELITDAGSLPDAIWPVEPSAVTAIVSQLNFDDLRAVDFVGGPWDSWGVAHRYTFGADGWPEWQPLSARILRRVIGEKVVIPSSVNAFTDAGNNAFNLSRLPSYIPRFAPIEADTADALLVYDTRYRSVALGAVGSENAAAGKLYYHVAYDNVTGNATFTFKKVDGMNGRFVRLLIACTDAAGKFTQVAPAVWNVADTAATAPVQGAQLVNGQAITATVTDNGATYTFVLDPPDNCTLVPGSEQLNRAFEYVDTANLAVMEGLAAHQFCLYTIPDPAPEYEGITKTLLSMLIFSKQDSGRTVKLDYIVADWGILRDDVTVDADGYAALTAPPRLNARASYPREAQPWGLLEPMTGGQANVVMTLVDLYSSNVFSVECDPDAKNKAFSPLEQGYRMSALLTSGEFTEKLIIDVADAQQKRFRLGVQDNSTTPASVDWHALAGQTFRVYYRAQRDWTVQFFRAPAVFGWTENPNYMGLTYFAHKYPTTVDPTSDANSIFVPGIYAGQSIAVDYRYRDTARVMQAETDIVNIGGVDTQVSVLYVDRLGALAVNDSVAIYHLASSNYITGGSPGVAVFSLNRKERRVTLDQELSVETGDFLFVYEDLQNDGFDQGDIEGIPLQRADGEPHIISAPDANGVSGVLLTHLPAEGTAITVRGASVAIRTLWTQPRSGEAYVVDNDSAYSFPEKIRTIGERWRGKTAVINLPVSGD